MFLSLQLLLLLTLTVRTDGHYLYFLAECITSSPDLTDMERIYSIFLNKKLSVQLNSTVGMFVGYTKLGTQSAESWNNGTVLLAFKVRLEILCRPALNIAFSSLLDKTVKPKIRLRSEPEPSGGHTAMLMCSAYDFFPPAIDVYWLRDGKRETTHVTATDELADGDWYYQIHSHLEYTPRSGERISCVVEHASFSEPMIYDWDPLPEAERSKIAIGASGLVLGIILSAAGFIYYKKKSLWRMLVPGVEQRTHL